MAALGTGSSITINGSAGLFAEVISITPPSLERGKIDVSHMGTTDYREYLPLQLMEVAEMEVEMLLDPDVDPSDYTDTTAEVVITFSTGATWTFDGSLGKYEPSVPLEDRMMVTATIIVAGGITVVAAP